MAELKMNSLGPLDPFCSAESGAKSWGYECVRISRHSPVDGVPLNFPLNLGNGTVRRFPNFPRIVHSGGNSEWVRTRKMFLNVQLFMAR